MITRVGQRISSAAERWLNANGYAGYLKDGKPDGMVAGRVNGRMFYHHYENGQIKQSHEDYTGRRLSNVNAITDDDLLFRICILVSENRSSNGPLYGDCENGNGILDPSFY